MKNLKLQRGFILGVTAVAVMAVATGAFMRLQSINADTEPLTQFVNYNPASSAGDIFGWIFGQSQSQTCDKVESIEPATLTDAEKQVVGETGKVYIVHNVPQNKDFRAAVGVSEVSKSGIGGVVKFTVHYSPVRIGSSTDPNTVYTEKKGRWLLMFNEDKYLDFYFNNPNLKIGSYQTLTKTVSIPDYAWPKRIDLQLRNGSGFYFQGCVGNVIDFATAITPATTPTASPSVSASASASASASVSASASASVTASVSASASSTVGTMTMRNGLKGDYYNGLEFKTGVLSRVDSNINFDWGNTSPNSAISKNNFSVRWTGSVKPKFSELYTLIFDHNDGMRVWVNDNLVLNQWAPVNTVNQSPIPVQIKPTVTSTRTVLRDNIVRDSIQMDLTANTLYSIKIEYYDSVNQAIAKMYWQSTSQPNQIVPKESLFTAYDPNPAAGTGVGLQGEYFSDILMTKFFTARTDKTVDFSWGNSAPITGMPKDEFTTRWTGFVQPRFSDLYTFMVNAKDGVRLWIDDELLIDQWVEQEKIVQYSGKIQLDGGVKYSIRLEYYNKQGAAAVKLLWKSMSQAQQIVPMRQLYSDPITTTVTPTVVPSVSPTVSPTETVSITPGPNQMVIKHGFNAVYLPEGMGLVSTDAFTEKGMTAFAFNRNGNKKWNTTMRMLNHWIGYYVYNPLSTTTINVSVVKMPESPSDKFITKGWNLLANSTKADLKVADMQYYVSSGCAIKAGEATCRSIGDNTELGDLLTSKRAYGYIYIIKDPYASDANNAFELVQVTAANVGSIKIPAGKLFWFYLYN